MSKFNKGDKVRVVKGVHAGLSGAVTDPWWQLSQSDWPCVEFLKENGTYSYADEDDMELAEDPYEYAIQRTIASGLLGLPMIVGDCWSTREETNMGLLNLTTERVTYKLVKRRKAGPIEDA